jgi:CheY-like chemotaxis protein
LVPFRLDQFFSTPARIVTRVKRPFAGRESIFLVCFGYNIPVRVRFFPTAGLRLRGDMATHLAAAPIALVVEDDPEIRELAAALLEETDLRVVECEDAEQALGALCKFGEDVALIFTDVRLPGLLDGVDLAQRVNALWPHISMVVTTGYPGERLQALPDNVVYMPKPWLALDVLVQAEHAADRARGWRAVA